MNPNKMKRQMMNAELLLCLRIVAFVIIVLAILYVTSEKNHV